MVPPPRLAAEIYALRALVKSGGRAEPLSGQLVNSAQVAAYYRARIGADRLESFWVVGLDARNQVRLEHEVARGSVASCPVNPVDVIRPVVLNACAAAIAIHNHPSGSTAPSADGVDLTACLASGFELLELRLLDHLIVGARGYFSFLDAGLLRGSV